MPTKKELIMEVIKEHPNGITIREIAKELLKKGIRTYFYKMHLLDNQILRLNAEKKIIIKFDDIFGNTNKSFYDNLIFEYQE
jgi:phosphopantetheine adenylyltransferase